MLPKLLKNGNRDGGPSIGYLEACRETEDKNILGKRVGYSGGGWHQGANIGARGGARAQIIGARVLLGSPKTLFFFFYVKKKRKEDSEVLLSLDELYYDKMQKVVLRALQEEQFEFATF